MMRKAPKIVIQASCVLLLLIGGISAQSLVTHHPCGLADYDGGSYAFYDNFESYEEAKRKCESKRGKLPMPTQTSWSEFLTFADSKRNELGDEGVWIGVTMINSLKSGATAVDADSMTLNKDEIRSMSLGKTYESASNQKDQQLCIVYFPTREHRFQTQQCRNSQAKVMCICQNGLKKRQPEVKRTEDTDPTSKTNDAPTRSEQKTLNPGPGNESISIGSGVNGRSANGNGGDRFIKNEDNQVKRASPFNSVAAILGIIMSVCLVATAYFLVKNRGKKIRDRISRQMPYNRSRSNENGDSYRRGRVLSEQPSECHRPIHVYEEILMRNSSAAPNYGSPMFTNGNLVPGTLPRLPPPEPPSTFVDIHDIIPETINDIGYLRPSHYRPDAIPGDVRSPPPANGSVFQFSSASENRSNECLLNVPEQALKYASVETVQTLLDGESEPDEEYLVDEECENAEPRPTCIPTPTCVSVFDVPKEQSDHRSTSPEFVQNNRSSTANPYVDIRDFTTCTSPPPGWSGEYENERFLRTVMKVAPKKPRRTMKKRDDPNSNYLEYSNPAKGNLDSTNPNLPVYSKVKKGSGQLADNNVDTGRLESSSLPSPTTDIIVGYTKMGGSSVQNVEIPSAVEVATYADIPEISVESWPNELIRRHDYELVPDSSRKHHISDPVMLSTTNTALNQSSLVCYEIPPEEYET